MHQFPFLGFIKLEITKILKTFERLLTLKEAMKNHPNFTVRVHSNLLSNHRIKMKDIAKIYEVTRHWCTNRHIDKNIAGLLFFHHSHLKVWLSWHLAQQGKVQVVIK